MGFQSRTGFLYRGIASAGALLLVCASLDARTKTDVVFLKNGDRVTCEIVKLERGKLAVKTDAMSTIEIEWNKIERVNSSYAFQVELDSGAKLFGTLAHVTDDGKLEVDGLSERTAVEYPHIVRIAQIEETFWGRLNGTVDLGYDYTQAQSSTQWSGHLTASYRTQKHLVNTELRSLLKKQEGAENVVNNYLNLSLNRFLRDRWFALGVARFEQNQSQELDLRTVLGSGVGRYVIQTNHMLLAFLGGATVTQENFTGKDIAINSEALTGTRYDWFRYNFPKLDFTTTFLFLPNLTSWGRVRLELDSELRFEVFKDFFWSAYMYERFDSNPPSETARKNDLGVGTALGWKF